MQTALTLVPKVNDIGSVQERIKYSLRVMLGDEVYDAWFTTLRLESIEAGAALFTVPTIGQRYLIRQFYGSAFAECCFDPDNGIDFARLEVRVPQPLVRKHPKPVLVVYQSPRTELSRPKVTWQPPEAPGTELEFIYPADQHDQLALIDWFLREPEGNTEFVMSCCLPQRVRIAAIAKATAQHYSIGLSDMLSQKRHRHISWPRQVSMYIAKQLTGRSLPEIGRRHGDRDHTTVLHAIKKVQKKIDDDPLFLEVIEMIRRRIRF